MWVREWKSNRSSARAKFTYYCRLEWIRRHFGVKNNNEFKYNAPVRWVSLKMKLHSLNEYLFIKNGNVSARMLCLRIVDEQIEHTKKCMYLCDKIVALSSRAIKTRWIAHIQGTQTIFILKLRFYVAICGNVQAPRTYGKTAHLSISENKSTRSLTATS